MPLCLWHSATQSVALLQLLQQSGCTAQSSWCPPRRWVPAENGSNTCPYTVFFFLTEWRTSGGCWAAGSLSKARQRLASPFASVYKMSAGLQMPGGGFLCFGNAKGRIGNMGVFKGRLLHEVMSPLGFL